MEFDYYPIIEIVAYRQTKKKEKQIMSMEQWRPFSSLAGLSPQGLFDGFFNSVPDTGMSEGSEWQPRVDVKDEKDTIVVLAELPGMSKGDIKVTYENNYLTISGERKLEDKKEDENYYRVERQFGRFSRSFRLSTEMQPDKISAEYKDGVLRLVLPKSEAKKPREISIGVN